MNKLDTWPCYKYGHKLPLERIQNAYINSVIDSDTTICCGRCGRELSIEEFNHPVITAGSVQRKLLSPSNYCPGFSPSCSD